MITGKDSEDILFYGKGAGQGPAASAVVSDIINMSEFIVTNTAGIVPDVVYDKKTKIKILPAGKSAAPYYLRFNVVDKPGVLSKISGILGKYKVSIASVSQPDMDDEGITQIIVTTHKTNRENLEKALKQIDASKSIVKAKTVKIKIEA